MIFVDTSIWFAANVAEDPHHAAARRLLVENRQPLVTTDYVVDEVITLLTVRGHRPVALHGRRSALELSGEPVALGCS